MSRRYVVTGSASGVGRATAELLKSRGAEVVGADLHDADIVADLSTADGRAAMVAGVEERYGGSVDAVIACAGISARAPVTISVNYFGAVATLEGLRPMLARGKDPRAVAVTSFAATMPVDDELIAAALSGDEPKALARAEGLDVIIYTSSKAALLRWCRAAAVSTEWAGAGILLNMVAPGMVDTPMVAHRLRDPAALTEFKKQLPLPIDRFAQPGELAHLLAFLVSPENSYLVGQNIFADGGSEAVVRGPERF